ncbi:DUF924 family protein [Gymnodinialimonas sp.]
MTQQSDFDPQIVLDLWFPDNGHWTSPETHMAFWRERMQGGMDARIIRDFAELTHAAAAGALDHWAETPRGRLALLIALDQFPRSLWRDTPGAFGQDIKATRLALDGIENGHFHALPHIWERQFYLIAISHCEGPDHLDRLDVKDRMVEGYPEICPPGMEPMLEKLAEQHAREREIIERFGRHPHRNPIYGRVSTPEEEAYIATGDFPHVKSTD